MLTRLRVREGKWGKVADVYQAEAWPLLRELPGFRGAIVFGDPATRVAGSLIRFDRQSQLQAALDNPDFQAVLAKLATLYEGAPERQFVQVLLEHDMK